MKIVSVEIVLEPETESEKGHATEISLKNQQWTANGPLWPRYMSALGQVYDLLRGKR